MAVPYEVSMNAKIYLLDVLAFEIGGMFHKRFFISPVLLDFSSEIFSVFTITLGKYFPI